MSSHLVDVAIENDGFVHASDGLATIRAVCFPLLPFRDAVFAEGVTAVESRSVDEEFGTDGALKLHLHRFLQISENRLSRLQLGVSLNVEEW